MRGDAEHFLEAYYRVENPPDLCAGVTSGPALELQRDRNGALRRPIFSPGGPCPLKTGAVRMADGGLTVSNEGPFGAPAGSPVTNSL